MNTDHEASRTLVKSPPELWAECSDAGSLARHLGEFGQIRITRLEPETIVAWEGDRASGTIRIEPSGWGTRVTLTAQAGAEEEPDEPSAGTEEPDERGSAPAPVAEEPAPEPVAEDPAPEPVAEEQGPEPVAEDPAPEVEPEPVVDEAGPADAESASARPSGIWARLRLRLWPAEPAAPAVEPVPVGAAPEPAHEESEPPHEEPEPADEEPEPKVEPDPAAEAPPLSEAEEPAQPEPGQPEPAWPEPNEPEPEPANQGPDPATVLTAALDSLGQAHHRPFSRA